MKTHRLIALALGTATIFASITCAPVGTPVPPEKKDAPPTPPEIDTKTPTISNTAPDTIKDRVEAAIAQVKQRDILTTNGFWTVFHAILGLGPSVTLLNPETRQRVNALDYIAAGGQIRGLKFIPTRDGLDVETRPGTFISQGHQDQFVAEMVQWGVPPDRKFIVGGKDYTFMDFVRNSKARASVKANQELEWALIIVGQHFGTDAVWKNETGEEVRFEDMVRQEMTKPMDSTAACGGTHRLFGLTWVYHLHLRHGGKTEGVWKEVADHTAQYKKLARQLQNPDGSFSTDFFNGRGNLPDKQLRMNTSGHIFEWLALALSDEELKEPWVRDAANALALMFLDIQGAPMEGGTLYHAVHGLLIYHGRVYGTQTLGASVPHVPLLPK